MELTRELLEKVFSVWGWLAEAGEEYKEQADAIRDIHYFCVNHLDVKEGIEQGYLDNEAMPLIKES